MTCLEHWYKLYQQVIWLTKHQRHVMHKQQYYSDESDT